MGKLGNLNISIITFRAFVANENPYLKRHIGLVKIPFFPPGPILCFDCPIVWMLTCPFLLKQLSEAYNKAKTSVKELFLPFLIFSKLLFY